MNDGAVDKYRFSSNTGSKNCLVRAKEQRQERTSTERGGSQALAAPERAVQMSGIAGSEGVQAEQGDSVGSLACIGVWVGAAHSS